MKKLNILAGALLIGGVAFAQNNATATLTGDDNVATQSQTGDLNSATITTDGSDNKASQTQTGSNHTATITQDGAGIAGGTPPVGVSNDNEAIQIQSGGAVAGNTATITQKEKGRHYAKQDQDGNNNVATISQQNAWGNFNNAPSNANYSNVHKQFQTGDDNEAIIDAWNDANRGEQTQDGNDNYAKLGQSADQNEAFMSQLGDDNYANVRQGNNWPNPTANTAQGDNVMDLLQSGNNNWFKSEQAGVANQADVDQTGDYSRADMHFQGDYNVFNNISQSSTAASAAEENSLDIDVYGDGNTSSMISQDGISNTASIQIGVTLGGADNNSVMLDQSGTGGNMGTITIEGSGNSASVTQSNP